MKRKHSTEFPVCPQERLVIISYTTALSFALERIGPLAAIIIIVFYLLVLYLSALSNTPENLFASIYSESLIKTACQHLVLLVGFDTIIYQKYYDTPPILVGHQVANLLAAKCCDHTCNKIIQLQFHLQLKKTKLQPHMQFEKSRCLSCNLKILVTSPLLNEKNSSCNLTCN
jgi:hypothetical protein